MVSETWTLIDQEKSIHCDDNQKFGNNITAHFRTLKSGLSAGLDVIDISNGKMSVSIIPTRGMNIWKAQYHDKDKVEPIGWQSPVRGPVHPSFVPTNEASGLGWLDGFDELLARCGLESNGAPEFDENNLLKYPLHGKISNKPAHKVELTIDEATGTLALTGWVEETRFHFLKVSMKSTIYMKLDQVGFRIEDEITNISANTAEIQMLYHMNFGAPLLEEGARVIAPFKEIVPRNDHAATGIKDWKNYAGSIPNTEEQVYFATLHANEDGNTAALLRNVEKNRGALLQFNVNQLPCFTVWKNTTAHEDGYVTGIEPGTNYPNPRTFEGAQKRIITLQGHETVTLGLDFKYCTDEDSVSKAEEMIKSMQDQPEIVHTSPQQDWCLQ